MNENPTPLGALFVVADMNDWSLTLSLERGPEAEFVNYLTLWKGLPLYSKMLLQATLPSGDVEGAALAILRHLEQQLGT